MTTTKPHYVALAAFVFFTGSFLWTSCKKETKQPQAPITGNQNTIDTTLLAGWWEWVDTIHNYKAQYFGPDHFYVRDTGIPGAGLFVGPDWWLSKDTLFVGLKNQLPFTGYKFAIIKLTKDSLITSENKFYRINRPFITSAPMKTIAGTTNDYFENTYGPYASGSLTADGKGNIYFCNGAYASSPYSVFKYNIATGGIDWIAGSISGNGVLADGTPAKLSYLANNKSIALDNRDNIFLLDLQGLNIHEVSASDGKVYQVPYQPEAFYDNDMIMGPLGKLYVANTATNSIIKINNDGTKSVIAGNGKSFSDGDGGPALKASFCPNKIAMDNSGNIFIADLQNFNIRRIDSQTGIISTIAGTGKRGYSGDGGSALSATFKQLSAICVANNGDVFVADTDRVRKITKADGKITTVAGDGEGGLYYRDLKHATAAPILPYALAVDENENLYISDRGEYQCCFFNKAKLLVVLAK